MKNLTFTELVKKFRADGTGTVLYLKYEYPGYTDNVKCGIITPLSEEELIEKYGNMLDVFKPYVLLPAEMQEIHTTYKNNEEKHKARLRKASQFNFEDGETEIFHPEIAEPDFTLELFNGDNSESVCAIKEAFAMLTEVQQNRVSEHLLKGKSLLQISKEEGKAYSAVYESYTSAIKRLKKLYLSLIRKKLK